MSDFVSSLLRFVLKLALGLMAAVFAVSLLAAALVVLTFSLLKALITGKKPAAAMVFSRFRGYAPQDLWARKSKRGGEVVDVDVRELRAVHEGQDDAEVHPTRSTPAIRRTVPAVKATEATDVTDKNATRQADVAP